MQHQFYLVVEEVYLMQWMASELHIQIQYSLVVKSNMDVNYRKMQISIRMQ